MLSYKIQNINYSIASRSYDRQSQAIQQTNFIPEIKDKILIQQAAQDFGGVESQIKSQVDILSEGDTIIPSSTSNNSFFNLVKEKFNQIIKSENISSQNSLGEANLVELTATINEATMAVEQIAEIRNKIVSAYKEILNSAL